jgi:hypothetical protein
VAEREPHAVSQGGQRPRVGAEDLQDGEVVQTLIGVDVQE